MIVLCACALLSFMTSCVALRPDGGNVVRMTKIEASAEATLRHTPEPYVYANYPGDVLLSAFFPIHGPTQGAWPDITCGPLQGEDGIQAVEAFFLALDEVNKAGILPNITLGAMVGDSCDDESRVLEQILDQAQVIMAGGTNLYQCEDGEPPVLTEIAREALKIVGVVGGYSSMVSIQLASFLKLFSVPQVSYKTTSPDMSNNVKYPFFKRTVPSDIYQAEAIMVTLKKMNWTYVNIVYDNSNYGLKGFAELEKFAGKHGICLANTLRIDYISPSWNHEDYDDIIRQILKSKNATVVVLFMDHSRAHEVFKAADRLNATGLTWVGSDGWSGRLGITEGLEHIVHNAIAFQPLTFKLPHFDDYFTSYNGTNNKRNIWWEEYWETHFQCQLVQSGTPYGFLNRHYNLTRDYNRSCRPDLRLDRSNNYVQQEYLHYVWDSVYAFAHAFKALHEKTCGANYTGLCPELQPQMVDGEQLLDQLTNVAFTAANGQPFRFFNGIDGPPRYTILQFNEKTHWSPVGNYSGVQNESSLVLSEEFKRSFPSYDLSSCTEPCKIGEIKQMQPGDSCCWGCQACDKNEIVKVSLLFHESRCSDCENGTSPNTFRNECIAIPETYMSLEHAYAIPAATFSIFGILWTCVTIALFFVYINTPIIKACGREISLYLLGDILLSFAAPLYILQYPTPVNCGATRLLIGVAFTIIGAAILTKTTRISRIFVSGSPSPKKARYTSPKAQLLLVNALVFVEVLIISSWLIASPPDVVHVYPTTEENVLVCSGEQDMAFLIALIYPFILLVVDIVYAFKTRKTPDGFNETRLIAFTCYTTFIIWLAFVPVYFLNGDPFFRTVTLCFALMLHASVALMCIFMPKMYICVLRPEKNTRDFVMNRSISVLSSASSVPTPDGRRISGNIPPSWPPKTPPVSKSQDNSVSQEVINSSSEKRPRTPEPLNKSQEPPKPPPRNKNKRDSQQPTQDKFNFCPPDVIRSSTQFCDLQQDVAPTQYSDLQRDVARATGLGPRQVSFTLPEVCDGTQYQPAPGQ